MPAPPYNFINDKRCICQHQNLECVYQRPYLYCRDCGGNRVFPQKEKRLWHKPVVLEGITLLTMPSTNSNSFNYKDGADYAAY